MSGLWITTESMAASWSSSLTKARKELSSLRALEESLVFSDMESSSTKWSSMKKRKANLIQTKNSFDV